MTNKAHDRMARIEKSLYRDGIRFECTGCGECCRARHGYGFIYVTLEERRKLARHLKISTRSFTMKYCEKTDGYFHLREPSNDCQFLDGERCTVYRARPEQCRTWPFWPENMNKKTWNTEVKRDCPGIGIGKLYGPEEIEEMLKADAMKQGKS